MTRELCYPLNSDQFTKEPKEEEWENDKEPTKVSVNLLSNGKC